MKSLNLLLIILIIIYCSHICINVYTTKKMNEKFEKIENVYKNNPFINVPHDGMGEQYSLTYGELTNDGVKTIKNCLEKYKNPNDMTFIDLGSGDGKALTYAIANGFKKAKGVEIVEERHNVAVDTINKLDDIKDDITLHKGDIFKLDPSFFKDKSAIFVSNLLFPPNTRQQLIKFLSDNTTDDTILFVSRIPDNLHKFKLIEELKVPMSWNNESRCYVLKK